MFIGICLPLGYYRFSHLRFVDKNTLLDEDLPKLPTDFLSLVKKQCWETKEILQKKYVCQLLVYYSVLRIVFQCVQYPVLSTNALNFNEKIIIFHIVIPLLVATLYSVFLYNVAKMFVTTCTTCIVKAFKSPSHQRTPV